MEWLDTGLAACNHSGASSWLGFTVLGFKVWDLGFRVLGLGFKVWDLGFGV